MEENNSKFESDFHDYKMKISTWADEKTSLLMMHSFCMGYCQLSNELQEDFDSLIDLDPVLDKINELTLEIKEKGLFNEF